ncbi:MAG TPA: hypothetical protein VG816_00055 [Solirubrobacterales bacterium]|nr:hypothetical protein [Solirubrobacterales bacterium]
MKQIRKRVTYANVMSSIAVFLVLGGGAAYAAKKIGSNEIKGNSITTGKIKKEAVSASKIKKNAVTTAKIANGAVTGAKLNLGSVGTVPNANHANTADNANNANTVGGNHVVSFSLVGHSPIGPTQILDLDGLQIIASCSGGAVTANAKTTASDGEISAFSLDASSGTIERAFDDSFNPGDEFELPQASNSDEVGQGRYSGGNLKFVDFTYNEEDEVAGNDCVFHGFATGN